MNLQQLRDIIGSYADFLEQSPHHDPYWKWEIQRRFQENWDPAATDFREMFDRSLQSTRTRRLWNREHYAPKDMMLAFIDLDRDFVRSAFSDLFDERREVEGRMDRFLFHCDELLRAYRERHPHSIRQSHYHADDYAILSHYLSWRFPDRYAPYDFNRFRALMGILGSRDIPGIHDVERFFKVARTLYKFLSASDRVMGTHRNRLDPESHYQGDTLLVVEDFMEFAVP